MSASDLVEQLLTAISEYADTNGEVGVTFRKALLPVCTTFLAGLSHGTGSSSTAVATDSGDDGKASKRKRVKSGKISTKNPYHFYVAHVMPEVKASTSNAKARMAVIGEKWKGVSEADKAPYNTASTAYNEKVKELVSASENPTDLEVVVQIKQQAQTYALATANLQVDVSQLDDLESTVSTQTQVVVPPPSKASAKAAPAPVPVVQATPVPAPAVQSVPVATAQSAVSAKPARRRVKE